MDVQKCAGGRADVDESGGERFFTGRFADGYLQKRGPQPGYTIVAFHLRHVADLVQLTEEESAGFWQDVIAVATALHGVFRPCHMNYNVLGNGVPHVHAHVIPRYLDDPSPGMPCLRGLYATWTTPSSHASWSCSGEHSR